MNNKELDDRLREFLIRSLDDARRFAVESRDTSTLGALAELAAKIIDFDPEEIVEQQEVGFQQGGRQ